MNITHVDEMTEHSSKSIYKCWKEECYTMVVDPRNYSIILIQNQTFNVAQLSYYEAWNIANNYSVIWIGVLPYINFGPIDSDGFYT